MKAKNTIEFLETVMAGSNPSYEKSVRNLRPSKKKLNPCQLLKESQHANIMESDEENDDYDDDLNDPLYTPPVKKARTKQKTGFYAFIPADVMANENFIRGAQRNKITPTTLSRMTKDFVTSVGGDISKINSSYSYAYNACKVNAVKTSGKIRNTWQVPSKCVLHYDGKLMEALDKSCKEERFPVVVSGGFGTKLLGVPTLGHNLKGKYGSTASAAVMELLEKWQCKDSIFGMVFDTPKTNIGQISGVCISIERLLNRPLLWLACRHHVGETIIRWVWNDLAIEKSSGPKTAVFQKLSEVWTDLDFSAAIYLPSVDPECEAVRLLSEKQTYLRDDYKEVVELSLLYLGAIERKSVSFRRPGAMHQARWMAKIIYAFKLIMFSNQELLSLNQQTLTKIKDFCDFAAKVYVPWWVQCSFAKKAPKNDMLLLKNIILWKSFNPIVHKSALKAFHRHLWYLSEKLVPLALFDESVSSEVKTKMVNEIMKKKEQHREMSSSQQNGRGYTKLKPTIIEQTTDLSTFVGRLSWTFFQTIGCSTDFFTKVSYISFS